MLVIDTSAFVTVNKLTHLALSSYKKLLLTPQQLVVPQQYLPVQKPLRLATGLRPSYLQLPSYSYKASTYKHLL